LAHVMVAVGLVRHAERLVVVMVALDLSSVLLLAQALVAVRDLRWPLAQVLVAVRDLCWPMVVQGPLGHLELGENEVVGKKPMEHYRQGQCLEWFWLEVEAVPYLYLATE